MDQQADKDKTERVIGLGSRTREEIVKWNQMSALRFQTGGDIRHPQPPFGIAGGGGGVTVKPVMKDLPD